MYYVYIVECKDGTLYTGCTPDIEKRLKEHNTGKGCKYTRMRYPVILRYLEEAENRSKAQQREYAIKQLSRKEKMEILNTKEAHKHSINHKDSLVKDSLCGCFYCMRIFSPTMINEWLEDISGTAVCPYCGIDSIIGASSGYPITREFLLKMNKHWF